MKEREFSTSSAIVNLPSPRDVTFCVRSVELFPSVLLTVSPLRGDAKDRTEQEVEDGEEHRAMIQMPRSERESRLSDPFT